MAKLTVATTFPVFPARGGGQERVLGLYGELPALGIDVDVICLAPFGSHGGWRAVKPGLRQLLVPKTGLHNGLEWELGRRAGVPMTDVALGLHHALTPDYGDAIAASAASATAVIACHPFPIRAIEAAAPNTPLLFEAQDVETDLKASLLDGTEGAEEVIASVRELEAEACAASRSTFVCSGEDGARLDALFGLDVSKRMIVPNGSDPARIAFADRRARAQRKRRLGLADTTQAVFIGSWHEPNVIAAREVLTAARERPDIAFVLVGSAGLALKGEAVPDNLDLCGAVDGGFLRSVLGLADVALNPMTLGSGTNLKMLDYCLAGVPVISTAFGARGLGLAAGEHYFEMAPDGLGHALDAFVAESPEAIDERVFTARTRVLDAFAWPTIARRWLAEPAMAELFTPAPAAA